MYSIQVDDNIIVGIKEIEVDMYKIYTGTTIPVQINRTILIDNITHNETETIFSVFE